MADSSWDNSGLPAQKKGMPTWAKVLLGCGVAMLLLMGACVGSCVYMAKNPERIAKWGANKFKEMAQKPWTDMQYVLVQLGTDEGATALYKANPGLSKRFATEEDFLKAVQNWRPKLTNIPKEMPDLMELMKRGDFQLNHHRNQDGQGVELRFRTTQGTHLSLTWHNGKLSNLDIY